MSKILLPDLSRFTHPDFMARSEAGNVRNRQTFTKCSLFLFVSVLLLISSSEGICSGRFWVFFIDKGHYENLSLQNQADIVRGSLTERAIDRRAKRGSFDFHKASVTQDLPLEEAYIDQLRNMGFRIHTRSRWFNAVSGYADRALLDKISELPFVRSVEPVRVRIYEKEPSEIVTRFQFSKSGQGDSLDFNYGESEFQTYFQNIQELHKKGLNGEGVVLALFDTGFQLNVPSLRHIKSQLIAKYDFIQKDTTLSNQEGDSRTQDEHGTNTLSTIAGFLPDTLVGPAYGATFFLAKTEIVNQEIRQEEDNWARAAEWADSLGVDIVSSSLGYSTFDAGQVNYTYQDMNGHTTIVTQAANFLGERGVLVVNSAGNEGGNAWYYITAPADGYQVLAVGALSSNGEVAYFSSRGPTADGRIKPDVCGLGVSVFCARPDGYYARESGTSLSCPLVAGVAAQVLSAFPELNLAQMLQIMRKSGDNAEHPDNNRGWGNVDALQAWKVALGKTSPPPFTAYQTFPNPYVWGTGSIKFAVELSTESNIEITVYNVLGQRVAKLADYGKDFLAEPISWDVRDLNGNPLPSGIYVYKIHTALGEQAGKFVVLH